MEAERGLIKADDTLRRARRRSVRCTAVRAGSAAQATASEKGASGEVPTGPVSWGERSMRCFHSCASGHGEKVVAITDVTQGTASVPGLSRYPIPGPGPSLPVGAQTRGLPLIGQRKGKVVATAGSLPQHCPAMGVTQWDLTAAAS